MPDASQRVSPLILPETYRLPPRPGPDAEPAVVDAYRQTGFLLGKDLRLAERGMALQLAVLHDSYAVRYRTHAFAALTLAWSRANWRQSGVSSRSRRMTTRQCGNSSMGRTANHPPQSKNLRC